jgi:putative ABC transport system substrate-binding protein
MQLIGFAVVLTLSLVLAPVAAGAEQAGKIPRLCFLTFDSRMTPSNRLLSSRASPVQFDPFFQRLHDLGYVDGLTITIDYLSADGRGERFLALAADCLRLKADIIVVTTTPAAQAAKNATRTIPIVMFPLGDPVGTGLVASLD